MIKDNRKVCFVVMGFGKKTDYESGRTLDLDATFEAIIEPAVSKAGLRCIRADEIMHSGIIDTEMYEMLLRADLVIADISTGNVNAVYELGVRHALRPNSTIIMKEAAGKLYFDLNHVSTFQYDHLGDDIGFKEAGRATKALHSLILEVMIAQKPDSPVYTYLPRLQQPRLSDEQYADLLNDAEAAQNRLSMLMHEAENALCESKHQIALDFYAAADRMKPGDAFIIQKLALVTYKSQLPSEAEALAAGLQIIMQLEPDRSNDPETLGIAGAIQKRLWLTTGDCTHLDTAIRHYSRGFEIRRDYYNGENLAICYDFRAATQRDFSERQYDQMSARKVRVLLVRILSELVDSDTFSDRSDRRWVFATLANCLFALGRDEDALSFEGKFLAEGPAEWEIETYTAGKTSVLDYRFNK